MPARMLDCRSSYLHTGVPEIGRLELLSVAGAGGERRLAGVLFCDERRSPASRKWRRRAVRRSTPAALGEHAAFAFEIRQYLLGLLRDFTFPVHRTGTEFQKSVLDEVARVPYGGRATYSEIACAVGNPKAVRAVGAANARNPLPLVIPCHRIVGSSDELTGYGGGLDAKRWLLELEAAPPA